ncbi:hypothetical protein GCM10025882_33490 [Acinetobacter gyllenbergii]|uniref:Uncharacterized protein n=1 Tax=Acinetobacter gyllenbergii CIP 110306 = MTCC 11365 TaxID=1217657 RepID=A0A829HHK0_9GAMM|nr:hypothetical protein [Acinetobacter gyllenbergii]EPF80480.1 hypothetical protein F957_02140 [Acinetobacter gyllenbergii CIP 110306 = MTCC 11365]EPH34213.1 hypothetical protein L293_3577 [Acinetobacter gyllenbergii CIP 110306 = MTCC 11365]ESK53646.1 hypothetical protein F987_00984 [Acinetobacter gyllenbergii NIPH 230]MCU4580854.1 hypothetical protein [Acinetobacter gyllenbergii]OBY74735.1 hypothetical protein NG55_07260 [Acinetobacter gyllenbergii]
MKKNIAITFLILLTLIQFLVILYLWKYLATPKIHVLERPLSIASSFDNYSDYTILPAGTVLYDDSDALNRRVMVYFNLQGVDFKFIEQDADILKQPSEVAAIRVTELADLLKSVPLTKKDIYLIIQYDESLSEAERLLYFKQYQIDRNSFE